MNNHIATRTRYMNRPKKPILTIKLGLHLDSTQSWKCVPGFESVLSVSESVSDHNVVVFIVKTCVRVRPTLIGLRTNIKFIT